MTEFKWKDNVDCPFCNDTCKKYVAISFWRLVEYTIIEKCTNNPVEKVHYEGGV